MFTNSCWIFATSLFVKNVGSKGYSQLFFFASLAALLYYMYFAVRGHKDKEPYNVYRGVLILAFLASLGCFLEPYTSFLKPFNDTLLYCFVVSVMTVDLVGTTLGPIVLQSSVNPAIFRQVYQKIIAVELTARITAAGFVWLLSQTHQLNFLYPFAWILLVLHFFLFGMTVFRMRVSQIKSRSPRGGQPPAFENVVSSFNFIFANPLVRVAMSLMVWSTVTKFVVENLFYQAADARFGSARQLASFVSVLTIVIYALSLVLHPLIIKVLNSRLQLSSLLSIQPLNILVLGGLALLLPPFWPLVLLMVTYNIAHRSIQIPMSRQCLVPVPRSNRGTIVSLISIFIALVTMITSGTMALLKNSLHLEDFLVFLLVLGGAILFMVTSLDSYYIRNLWSLFQEVRSGTWQEEQLDGISIVELESAGAFSDSVAASSELRSHPVLETYASSFDKTKLQSASSEHRSMLESTQPELLLSGLKICYVADFPWFRSGLAKAVENDDLRIKTFAENVQLVNKEFAGMADYSSVFRRRIKTVAFELLESENGGRSFKDLKNLLSSPDHSAAEALIAAMADARFKSLRPLLLQCISDRQSPVSVKPIIDTMFDIPFQDAVTYRELLDRLPFGKRMNESRKTIEDNLSTLKLDKLALGQHLQGVQQQQLELFMHTLFLEEYRLSAGRLDKALTESIAEFSILSLEESGILIDMHLSFLKRSDLFSAWESILTVLEPSTVA